MTETHAIPKDIIIKDDSSMYNDDSVNRKKKDENSIDSKSVQNGLVRMVTPPKPTSITTDYLGPVEMQY